MNVVLCLFFCNSMMAQNSDIPWTPQQMIAPEMLAGIIKGGNTNNMLIISVGPSGLIKNAVDNGPVRDKEGVDRLKKLLSAEKKDRAIIVYCGCCPYKNCPNIRPAYAVLKELKFTNFKLLNLPQNLKSDWIDKGYPMSN